MHLVVWVPISANTVHFLIQQRSVTARCLMFRHCWERIVQFEPNTMQTNMFTKPYLKANWSSRTNEKRRSTPSRPHRLLEIPARRHYFNDVLRIFLLTGPPRTSSGTGEWIFHIPSPPPATANRLKIKKIAKYSSSGPRFGLLGPCNSYRFRPLHVDTA
jgi:hypothetical protein